jgi:hypothetical protein
MFDGDAEAINIVSRPSYIDRLLIVRHVIPGYEVLFVDPT